MPASSTGIFFISVPQRRMAPWRPPSPESARMASTREEAIISGWPVWPWQTGQASDPPDSISCVTVREVKSGMSTGVKRMRSHLSFR